MTCNPPHGAGPNVSRRMPHKISQQHIFMVLRISRGKDKGFGKKVSPSPTALCLSPSSMPPLHTNARSADCLQHPQRKRVATPTQVFPMAKHSTDGYLFNERETCCCLLPQAFPPPWFTTHSTADISSGFKVSASGEAETSPVSYPVLGPRCGGIAPPHTPWAWKGPGVCTTSMWGLGGARCPGWGARSSIHRHPNPASALKKQLKRESTLKSKVKEKSQNKKY